MNNDAAILDDGNDDIFDQLREEEMRQLDRGRRSDPGLGQRRVMTRSRSNLARVIPPENLARAGQQVGAVILAQGGPSHQRNFHRRGGQPNAVQGEPPQRLIQAARAGQESPPLQGNVPRRADQQYAVHGEPPQPHGPIQQGFQPQQPFPVAGYAYHGQQFALVGAGRGAQQHRLVAAYGGQQYPMLAYTYPGQQFPLAGQQQQVLGPRKYHHAMPEGARNNDPLENERNEVFVFPNIPLVPNNLEEAYAWLKGAETANSVIASRLTFCRTLCNNQGSNNPMLANACTGIINRIEATRVPRENQRNRVSASYGHRQ